MGTQVVAEQLKNISQSWERQFSWGLHEEERNRTVHTDRVTSPNPWVGRLLQITHQHYWGCKIPPCSAHPAVGPCPKGLSGFCYRANTMPRSPETKINEPFFLLEAQNLSLFTKSSQVNRSCTMKAEKKSDPKKKFWFVCVEVQGSISGALPVIQL